MAKVSLVQWGRKGAGPKLLLQIALQLRDRGNDVQVSFCSSNDYVDDFVNQFKDNRVELEIPNKLCLLSPFHIFKNRKKFLILIRQFKPDLVVFVMPHPWDTLIRTHFKTARIIHDAHRHPGDLIWPTSASFKKRAKLPDDVIVLSDSVKNALSSYNLKLHVATHPIFEFSSDARLPSKNIDVLVIGRQRKYKGTANLSEVWPKVQECYPQASLTIAGQGKIPRKVKKLKNIVILNKWLSDYEIDTLLKSAKCVLFPYLEASQSGLLPASKARGAQVVVTPVGGLIEQARFFEGIIADGVDVASIAEAVILALSTQNLETVLPLMSENSDLSVKIEKIAHSG